MPCGFVRLSPESSVADSAIRSFTGTYTNPSESALSCASFPGFMRPQLQYDTHCKYPASSSQGTQSTRDYSDWCTQGTTNIGLA